MFFYKGTYGLMIRFKAAWADTSRDFSRAADWPGRRQSVESAEWVKSHRPAPNPLYLSRGGALGMKTRLGVSYPVKKNGHCLVFVSFVSHLLKEDSDRYGKCCIRSSPTLICVTARERSVPALATAQAAAFLGASGGGKKADLWLWWTADREVGPASSAEIQM